MARIFSTDFKRFKFEHSYNQGLEDRLSESSSRGSFSLSLGGTEVCWLSKQLEDFFFSKGGQEWVKVFRGPSKVSIFQLGCNTGGRFLVIEDLDRDGRGQKIVFSRRSRGRRMDQVDVRTGLGNRKTPSKANSRRA